MTAFSEMYHHYGIPIFSFAGCSDAKVFDQQAAIEGALWMLVTALGGGNLIHDVGYVESGMTASYQQLVAMNEVAGLVKRFMRGVEISEETIALDVIDQVGPGGHFLGEEHTFDHFRRNWIPDLFDRLPRDEWQSNGGLTLGDRAADRVREILEGHQPAPLDEAIAGELESIIQRAEERVL
jgi:trimethylamine--corrinoid protein Co-methyltransferase